MLTSTRLVIAQPALVPFGMATQTYGCPCHSKKAHTRADSGVAVTRVGRVLGWGLGWTWARVACDIRVASVCLVRYEMGIVGTAQWVLSGGR